MIWVSQVLTPFSISGFAHVFLGPLPGASKKPDELNKLFPCYYRCKPQTFQDKYYELGFMSSPHRVFRSYSSTKNEVYISWLDKVEKKKSWKDQRIFDLIQLSRFFPKYNANMIISTLFFYEGSRFGSKIWLPVGSSWAFCIWPKIHNCLKPKSKFMVSGHMWLLQLWLNSTFEHSLKFTIPYGLTKQIESRRVDATRLALITLEDIGLSTNVTLKNILSYM